MDGKSSLHPFIISSNPFHSTKLHLNLVQRKSSTHSTFKMEDTNTDRATKRLAVVTGANKGIGFEICRRLASNGVLVLLTARDETKGAEAVEKLQGSGLSDVFYHQLDVTNPASIASLANFIKTQFGKLDILVNNAGISGTKSDDDVLRAVLSVVDPPEVTMAKCYELVRQTPELAKECLQANYYGTKRVTEELLPLLQLSDSPRIVNLSSSVGKLENVANEWAKEVLSDVDSLTEERVDEVLNKFLKDFKESQGWPAYNMSKAALNAYTRILAKKFPKFAINCVSPGFVKTDFTFNTGYLTVEEGAEGPTNLALLPDGGPSGLFFLEKEVTNF